jgi:hypothetical protein
MIKLIKVDPVFWGYSRPPVEVWAGDTNQTSEVELRAFVEFSPITSL